MSSTGKLRLLSDGTRPFASTDESLLDVLRTKANWVWSIESTAYTLPLGPSGEQRAFRKTFSYSAGKGKATKAKFIIAADDYFALYVDGVMVQPGDGTHDWQGLVVFEVPLPVIQTQTSPSSMLLGFRVVNRTGWVGLLVAVQVDYESGDPDVFYTGLDDSWQGERTFDEGWEQPWYKSDSWARVSIIAQRTRSPTETALKQEVVRVFESLPASAAPGVCSTSIGAAHSSSIELSVGAFAGILAGAVLAALVIGVVGTLLWRRRRGQDGAWMDNGGVAAREPALMSEPLQLPGDPPASHLTIAHRSTSYEEYRPNAVGSRFSQTASPNSAAAGSAYPHSSTELQPPTYSENPADTGTMSSHKAFARNALVVLLCAVSPLP